MALIQDDQLVLMLGQIKLRLGKPGAVGVGFEVELGRGPAFGYFERARGLADLTRPEQRHGGHAVQQFREFGRDAAPNHPCNYGVQFQICKEDLLTRRFLDPEDGVLESARLGEIDPEPIAPALVFAGHLGAGVAERLLHIALVDLGRGGEAGGS